MATLYADAENTLTLPQIAKVCDIVSLNSYGSIIGANKYFDNRLRNYFWVNACNTDKKSALTEATAIIDTLGFISCKFDKTQPREFPRLDGVIPTEIEIATYEIAIQLLSGVDPNLEVENLASYSQGFSTARVTYERAYILDYIAAGVPSAKAWSLLKPYLLDPRSLKISRD